MMKGLLATAFLVLVPVIIQAAEIPAPAVPGNGALLSAELIYPLDDKPTPQCHASTIEETGSGLVAAWFGGKHEKNKDVGIWVSRNGGKGWEKPVKVASGAEGEDREYPCWNPVLFKCVAEREARQAPFFFSTR